MARRTKSLMGSLEMYLRIRLSSGQGSAEAPGDVGRRPQGGVGSAYVHSRAYGVNIITRDTDGRADLRCPTAGLCAIEEAG